MIYHHYHKHNRLSKNISPANLILFSEENLTIVDQLVIILFVVLKTIQSNEMLWTMLFVYYGKGFFHDFNHFTHIAFIKSMNASILIYLLELWKWNQIIVQLISTVEISLLINSIHSIGKQHSVIYLVVMMFKVPSKV